MRCRFTSKAETELQDALNCYQASGADLGVEFLAEVEATIRRIVANPTAWAPMSARARWCRTHRFPFGLFYQIRNDGILILSVMDLRRDPKRWESLL